MNSLRLGLEMAEEYWWCRVGPIDRSKVPWGGDLPMRQSVASAFRELVGEYPVVVSSGWGMDQQEADAVAEVHHEHFERRMRDRAAESD